MEKGPNGNGYPWRHEVVKKTPHYSKKDAKVLGSSNIVHIFLIIIQSLLQMLTVNCKCVAQSSTCLSQFRSSSCVLKQWSGETIAIQRQQEQLWFEIWLEIERRCTGRKIRSWTIQLRRDNSNPMIFPLIKITKFREEKRDHYDRTARLGPSNHPIGWFHGENITDFR